jgi:polyisoprenoid-binding protein YceI
MKNILSILAVSILFLSFVTYNSQRNDYKVDRDFTMKIKGSSNVHDWESTIETLNGSAAVSFSDSGEFKISNCQVSIPVNSIKSSKGNKMDKKTMKALKESDFPTIDFTLLSFNNVVRTDDKFTAEASGNLKVAGETRKINLAITGNQLKDGSIEIQCSKDMKMTDFNIDPPTALLGVMKTRDEITVEFRIILKNT